MRKRITNAQQRAKIRADYATGRYSMYGLHLKHKLSVGCIHTIINTKEENPTELSRFITGLISKFEDQADNKSKGSLTQSIINELSKSNE